MNFAIGRPTASIYAMLICMSVGSQLFCASAQQLETYQADALRSGSNWYLYNSDAQFGRTRMSSNTSQNTDGKSNPEVLRNVEKITYKGLIL